MPTQGANHFERGRVLFEQGRWTMATDAFRAYLATDPLDSAAYAMLAVALAKTSPAHAAAAVAASDESLRLDANDAYNLYARAIVALYADVPAGPGGPPAAKTKAVTQLRVSRHFGELAVRSDPTHLPSWRLLARVANDLNEPVAMRAAAEQALRVAPTDAASLGLLARSFEIAGQHTAALAAAEAGLSIAPNDAALQSVRAWALLQRGNDVAAEQGFIESLRVNPTDNVTQKGLNEARRNQQVAAKWWQIRLSDKPRRLRSNQVTPAQASSVGLIVAAIAVFNAITRSTSGPSTSATHATQTVSPIVLVCVAVVTIVAVLIVYHFGSSRRK